MKTTRPIYLFSIAIALAGCEYINSNDGFEFSQVDDKIEGAKLVAHRQFINDTKTLIADTKFVCDQNKKLSFELSSLNSPEKKGEGKLTGSPFILNDDKNKLPEGKIKLGGNEAIDLSKMFGLSVASFSNAMQWSIQNARFTSDLANVVLDHNKVRDEFELLVTSNPMLRAYFEKTENLEENKSKLDKYEKEQIALADKSSEDFEKQSHLNKIKILKDSLNIDADEKFLSEFTKNSQKDIAKYSELQTKYGQLTEKVSEAYRKMVGSDPNFIKTKNSSEAINRAFNGLLLARIKVAEMSPEEKKIVELGSGSISDGDFLRKLGNPIALQYKAKNGIVTFSIDLADKNLQKVIAACQ